MFIDFIPKGPKAGVSEIKKKEAAINKALQQNNYYCKVKITKKCFLIFLRKQKSYLFSVKGKAICAKF